MSRDEKLLSKEAENTEHLPDFKKFFDLLDQVSKGYRKFRYPGFQNSKVNIDNHEREQDQESSPLPKIK